jgi:transposase
MFSYLSPEVRVREDHPLRAMRIMVDEVLRSLSPQFSRMYAKEGRPSIAPEKLLRAQLLQMLYSIRSERLLMEEIDYSILFRWFVGLNLDEEVWHRGLFKVVWMFTFACAAYNLVRLRNLSPQTA